MAYIVEFRIVFRVELIDGLTDAELILPNVNVFREASANDRRDKFLTNFVTNFLELQMLRFLGLNVLNAWQARDTGNHLIYLEIINHVKILRVGLSCAPSFDSGLVGVSIRDINIIPTLKLCVLKITVLDYV